MLIKDVCTGKVTGYHEGKNGATTHWRWSATTSQGEFHQGKEGRKSMPGGEKNPVRAQNPERTWSSGGSENWVSE